jgi:hypothetical protein
MYWIEREASDLLKLEGKRFLTPKHRGDKGEMIATLFENAYFFNIEQRKFLDYIENLGLYRYYDSEIEKMKQYKDPQTLQEFVGLESWALEIRREKTFFGGEKMKIENVGEKETKGVI